MKSWMLVRSLAAALVALSVSACASAEFDADSLDELEDGEFDTVIVDEKADAFGIREGTPEATGILRVANETIEAKLAATTDVGLGTRTAGAIVKVRAGMDGRDNTSDDVRFTTLAALDVVPYTGTTAFTKLLAYARKQGYVTVPTSGTREGKATRVPFSGYWWSMQNAELAMGWSDANGRSKWTDAQARDFDRCITSSTPECTRLIDGMAVQKGVKLAPLMKFDLWFRRTLTTLRAATGSGVGAGELSRATGWELDHHYIGTKTAHRYWASRGYAGKCIGWALSTMFHDEPTKEVELAGIVFKPSDIKGILAALYNGAQFFIPVEKTMGYAYHNVAGENTQANYQDVLPHELLIALAATIDKGQILEADLDPGDGVWNYPIHRYTLSWKKTSATKVTVSASLFHADDEVAIDGVFSTNAARPDLKRRDLTFELTVPSNWNGDLTKATSSRWTGASVDDHPDALILGIESSWRTEIYSYSATQMNTEVNYQLIKRARPDRTWVPMIDQLLSAYQAKNH